MLPREKRKATYHKALVQRYHHINEVKRIERHRHLPKSIMKATKTRRAATDSEKRKHKQRLAHSAPGVIKNVPARKTGIVSELE
jgi:WD repeat and SOF domain-containing protein 1